MKTSFNESFDAALAGTSTDRRDSKRLKQKTKANPVYADVAASTVQIAVPRL